MGDIRPFWAVEPRVIRRLASQMGIGGSQHISTVHVRSHNVKNITNGSWRAETFAKSIEPILKHLPDMDIPINRLDQPRLVVPWEDMQELLETELKARQMPPGVEYGWTEGMAGLWEESKVPPLNQSGIPPYPTLRSDELFSLSF